MISYEEAGDMLDEIAESLPKEFYKYLNGGILLFPELKHHPSCNDGSLYVLGEYHNESGLGRYIIVYHGSFVRVHPQLKGEEAKEKLKGVLLHEFTHHLESLSGQRDLEIKDARDIAEFKRKKESARRVGDIWGMQTE